MSQRNFTAVRGNLTETSKSFLQQWGKWPSLWGPASFSCLKTLFSFRTEINYQSWPLGVPGWFGILLRTKGQGTKPGLFFFFFKFLFGFVGFSLSNEVIGLPYLTRWIRCGEKITEFNQHSHSGHVVRNNHSKKHMEK